MSDRAYRSGGRSAGTMTFVIGLHAVILGAVALSKMDLPEPPRFKPLTTRHIPLPPPDKPKPVERVEKPADAPTRPRDHVTVAKPVVDTRQDTPVAAQPNEPTDAFPPLTPGEEITVTVPKPLPLPDPIPLARPVSMKPRTNPSTWVTNADYPESALRAEEQGRTAIRLDVSAEGRPTACTVTGSSGARSLDQAACRLVMRRARFVPGKDASGAAVGGTYTKSFAWQIPD